MIHDISWSRPVVWNKPCSSLTFTFSELDLVVSSGVAAADTDQYLPFWACRRTQTSLIFQNMQNGLSGAAVWFARSGLLYKHSNMVELVQEDRPWL